MQRDAVDQVLQAVKFTDKNASGLNLELEEEFQAANCFSELIRGYTMGLVEPYTMLGLQPTGATRVTLEVIIPSPTGLTPAKWKQTATLCPLDWPSNYSLIRLWHMNKSFHQYAAQLNNRCSTGICSPPGKSIASGLQVGDSFRDQLITLQRPHSCNMYKHANFRVGGYENGCLMMIR